MDPKEALEQLRLKYPDATKDQLRALWSSAIATVQQATESTRTMWDAMLTFDPERAHGIPRALRGPNNNALIRSICCLERPWPDSAARLARLRRLPRAA